MSGKISIEDLVAAESAVLNRIAAEIDGEINDGAPAAHQSHSSGHSSKSGHNSSVARVEAVDDDADGKSA